MDAAAAEDDQPRPRAASLLARASWVVVLGLTAALAFAYLLPQDLWDTNPRYLTLCLGAFFTRLVQFYISVVLILIGAAWAWRGRRRLAATSLTVGLLAAAPMLWDALPLRPQTHRLTALRVMSMNLMGGGDAAVVDREVRAADPDVIVMQEFKISQQAVFRDTLGVRFPHQYVANSHSAVAVYSKLPLRTSSEPRFAGLHSENRVRFEIDLGGGETVALYGVHVPRFTTSSIPSVAHSRVELARLLAYIASDPLPVIVAGDFNFSEETPNAAAVRATGLASAHTLAGSGLALTRRVQLPVLKHLLGARIDHVYLRAPLTAARFSVGGETGSDHLPIVVDVAVNKPLASPVEGTTHHDR